MTARHLPTVVALCLVPPAVAIGVLVAGLAVLEALASWCPCGDRPCRGHRGWP